MKKVVFAVLWAFALSALAQAQKPAPKDAAKPAPMKEAKKTSKRGEDARHCLEKGSNTEIIKCAEAYL
jgi:hypothetical protein